MTRWIVRRRSALALLPLFAACGGDGTVAPITPTTASVVVTGTPSVDVGKTIQLTAVARNANDVTIPGKTFTWSSTSDAIASVSSTGLVTGHAIGAATISATVDSKSGVLEI